MLAIVVLLGLTIAAAAWAFSVAGGDGDPETDTDTTTDIDADTDVYDLSVGDCLNDPVDTMSDELVEVDSVESVACDEPHEAEVYALVDLPGGDDAAFPGDDGVTQQADEVCFERFEEYVGATYEESSLDYSYYLPTSGSWSAGDREVACLAVDYEGELLTGSVRGSGR